MDNQLLTNASKREGMKEVPMILCGGFVLEALEDIGYGWGITRGLKPDLPVEGIEGCHCAGHCTVLELLVFYQMEDKLNDLGSGEREQVFDATVEVLLG